MAWTRALLALGLLVWAAPAAAARYAVVVGTNTGSPPDAPLAYAEDDAQRMADVLTSLAGFEPQNTTVLRSMDAETMRRAIVSQNERLRLDGSTGEDSVLVVYYSGHADDTALRMGASRFAFDELQQLVRGSPAKFRILVVDACRSGAITALKGGKALAPIDVSAAADLQTEGFVVLASAAAGEAAQESRVLGGSFFTHHLVSGLLGGADDDADDAVSLDEAYRHAFENTLRDSSVTLAGSQHPTYRYDLRGQGNLVLTRLVASSRSRGRLFLPRSIDFLVLANDEAGRVVAEARRGRERALWLPPGRYFVRGRAQRSLLEGEIEVRAGQTLMVREDELRRVEYTRLVRKGADETVTLAHGPTVVGWMRSGLTAFANPCFGVGAGWMFTLRYVSLEPRLSWCQEHAENHILVSTTNEYTAQLRALYTVDLPFQLGLEVGTAAGGTLFRQDFLTRGNAPPTSVGAGTLSAFVAFGAELPQGFMLRGEFEGRTVFVSMKGIEGKGELSTPLVAVSALRIAKFF